MLNIRENLKQNIFFEIVKIADGLIKISFENNKNATFLNIINKTTQEGLTHTMIEEDLFSLTHGVVGDLIFFTAVYKITGEDKYQVFAMKLYNSISCRLTEYIKNCNQSGLLSGISGIIYSFCVLFDISKNIFYLNELNSYFKKIDLYSIIKNDKKTSLSIGLSGLLLALCKYYTYNKHDQDLLKIIDLNINSLLSYSKKCNNTNGIYWNPVHHKSPLAGMAHGGAGYSLAFHKAYLATKRDDLIDVVKAIVNFENTFYNHRYDNWSDNRDFISINAKYLSIAWSHGSPGIGLSRIKLLKDNIYDSYFNNLLKNNIETSIISCKKYGFNNDNKDILVYGNMGNLDLLIEYEKYVNNLEALNLGGLIEKLINKEWNYGFIYNNIYKPGFFNGSSGIGYQLIRLLDTETPSILTFD